MLRAVAVMMVVGYHGLSVMPDPIGARARVPAPLYLGYAGVDLFFVISGFIITHSIAGPIDVRGFVLKRLARILPFYWAATLLVALLWLAQPALVPVRGGGGFGAALVRSLLLVPEAHRPLLGVGWTLQHEFIFYALVAALAAAGAQRHALAASAALFAAGVLLHGLGLPGPLWDFRLLSLYWGEFALGILAYRIAARRHLRSPAPLLAGGVAGLLATGWIATPLLPHTLEVPVIAEGAFGLVRVLGFGGSAFLLLLGGLALERRIEPARTADRWAIELGGASFVIYLFHNLVLQGTAAATHRLHLGVPACVVVLAGSVALIVAGGVLLHRHVERPLNRAMRDRLTRHRGDRMPALVAVQV